MLLSQNLKAMKANQFCRLLIRDQGYELVIMKIGDTGRDIGYVLTCGCRRRGHGGS